MTRDLLSLQEAADRLGVHYMTAYRYVRLGRLAATMRRGQWAVRVSDVDAFARARRSPGRRVRRGQPDWREHRSRLRRRLVAGDVNGSWAVVEGALVAGADPAAVYVDLLAPVLRQVGDAWVKGTLTVADEHRAAAAARGVIGRLGPRFTRRGRTRGLVVLGGAHGDRHELPLAMLADVARGAGFDVVDLGTNTPIEALLDAAAAGPALVAVGVSVGSDGALPTAFRTVRALHRAHRAVPVLVGGPAILDAAHAARLGADGYAPDARTAVAELDALTRRAAAPAS